MQQNRSVPAPIFNARKRPRQAMIADPQSASGQPGPAGAAQYQGLMPPGGFNGSYQQQRQQQYGSMSGRGDNNRSRGRGTFQTGPVRQNTSQQMPYNRGQGSNNMIQQTGFQSNYQNNAGPMSMGATQCPGGPQPYQIQQQADTAYNPSRTYSFSNKRTTGQSQLHSQQQTVTASYNYGPYGSGTTSYSCGRGRGYTQQQQDWPAQRNYPNNPQATVTSNAAAFDDSFDESMNAIPAQMLNQSAQKTQPSIKKTQTKESTETQRLVTVRTAGIKRWAKQSGMLPLLYEVFGQLDSAIGRSHTDCKEFLLKDDAKDTIKCVFFEIDRQMIKMTRGQYYRVVGTYDQKQDRLKCISVRAMTDAERPLIQTLLDKSSQELARLSRQAREQ